MLVYGRFDLVFDSAVTKIDFDKKMNKMCLNLQLQLIYHLKVATRIHQNGNFLLPMHHLVLQVDNLELGILLLMKFLSQPRNSRRIIRLVKVDLELSIEGSLMMELLLR